MRLSRRLGISTTEFLAAVHLPLRAGAERGRRGEVQAGRKRPRLPVHAPGRLRRVHRPPDRLPLLPGGAGQHAPFRTNSPTASRMPW
ncbi:MAG: hypothetical protein MZV65_12920 [Chromatiales bacterium]|nr:hypothetical protein [Chromatiales bacterium]